MIIYVNNIILDAGIDLIIAQAANTKVHLMTTTTMPANYAAVIADSIGSFTPTLSKKDNPNAGLGRMLEIATGSVTVDTATNHAGVDQTFNQYALVNTVTSVIYTIGSGTAKLLANGDTANTPVFTLRILDGVVAP